MSYRIVLLEENPMVYEVMRGVLEKEGFEVNLVKNEDEFKEQVDSFQPHVVIMSTDMFSTDGYEFCRNFKSSRGLPVLLTGGAYEPFDEELALLAGADDYIQKPFDGYGLICKVKSILKIEDVKSIEEFSEEKPLSLIKSPEPFLLTVETIEISEPPIDIQKEEETILIAETSSLAEDVGLREISEFDDSSSLKESSPLTVDTPFFRPLEDEDIHKLIGEPLKSFIDGQIIKKMSEEISLLVRDKLIDIINRTAPKIVEEVIEEKMNATLLSIQIELQRELKKSLLEINSLLNNKGFKRLD